MSLGWDFGCWGYMRYGQEERGHEGSWSCGPGLSGLRNTELESSYGVNRNSRITGELGKHCMGGGEAGKAWPEGDGAGGN